MSETRPPPPELLAFLAPYPDEVVEVDLALRARILGVMPNTHETVWDATNAVAINYGPSPRTADNVVHLAAYSGHVNLGFGQGARLPDPAGVLEGTGSHIRHCTFKTLESTNAEWIESYVRAAVDQAGLPADFGDGGTTIRVTNGPKRRPAAPTRQS